MFEGVKEHIMYWYSTANRRARLNMVLSFLGILILTVFGVVNYDSPTPLLPVMLFGSALTALLNLLLLLKTRNVALCNTIMSAVIFVLSINLLIFGGQNGTGFLWTFPLISIAIFTLSFRTGVLYTALFLISATAIYFWSLDSDAVVQYDTLIFSRYIASSITLYIVCLASVYIQERSFYTINKINKKLEQSAYTDALTKLYNRRYFNESLITDNYFDPEKVENSCVMLMDIDHFKPINDEHGHDTGDKALRIVAQTIKSKLRSHDLVVRWGGEEFLVVVSGSPLPIALLRANDIKDAIEHNQQLIELIGHPITISIGVATIDLSLSATENINVADSLLYQAKEGGRNKVVG